MDAGNGAYFPDPNSPCINAGNPHVSYCGEYDIDGRTRVIYGHADIGACEYMDGVLPEDEPLPYMTSFQWFEGYKAFESLHCQKNWCVEGGEAMVLAVYGMGWCWQYVFADPNSQVSKDFDSHGVHDEVIRARIAPGKGLQVSIINDTNTIAAVRFTDDLSIEVLDGGVFQDTGCSWQWSTEYHYWGDLKLVVDPNWVTYDVYWKDVLITTADLVEGFTHFDRAEFVTKNDWLAIDRFSVTGQREDSLSCHHGPMCMQGRSPGRQCGNKGERLVGGHGRVRYRLLSRGVGQGGKLAGIPGGLAGRRYGLQYGRRWGALGLLGYNGHTERTVLSRPHNLRLLRVLCGTILH